MIDKPIYPIDPFEPWPYIPVDQTEGGDYQQIASAAVFAADGLMLSDAGPSSTAPRAQQISAAVEEALLYLLEMGLIDIDADRLAAYNLVPHPPCREDR